MDPSKIKKEHLPRFVQRYFERFYIVRVNGKRLSMEVDSIKMLRAQNVLVIRFVQTKMTLKAGDTLEIRNILFFRDFGPSQTNRTTVRIPQFGIDDGHVATITDYTFTYTFGASKQ